MAEISVPNTSQEVPQSPPAKKKRHGCLTTWLILIIIANIVLNVIDIATVLDSPDDYAGWVIPFDIIMLVWMIVCVVAIFMWKKWGFFGIAGVAVVQAVINLIFGNYFGVIQPFIALAFLYGVLNIGKENKGWTQLE